LGADVTGVCSGANLDLVRSLGAATVIDYTAEDFTQNQQPYDVIRRTARAGSHSPGTDPERHPVLARRGL